MHGFRHHRGAGTAILEAKLEMQEATATSRPCFQIFIDLTKAYDSVDRERLLDIMAGYGVGPNALRFLRHIWGKSTSAPRSEKCYGPPVHGERGAWQGDVLSPDEFDVINDCILREFYRLVGDHVAIFYADDGRQGGYNAAALQNDLDVLIGLVARIGLYPNVSKTKAMVSIGRDSTGLMSDIAYKRKYNHALPTYWARKLRKVECLRCHKHMNDQYLLKHMREIHLCRFPIEASGQQSTRVHHRDPGSSEGRSTKRRRTGSEATAKSHPPTPAIHDCHISFPSRKQSVACPVPRCPGRFGTRERLRRHFCMRHPNDQLEIIEEGQLERCPRCGKCMHSIAPAHFNSKFCIKHSARREERVRGKIHDEAKNVRFFIGRSRGGSYHTHTSQVRA